ncbi:hypothetical protein SH661x_001927 [Planctomicrobium sp. SH661]|uniref:hypothetical protein n=1 Tax=Planctomicrobium sp. SH661 TaxID=3448124 RepID=UPI003F5BDD10
MMETQLQNPEVDSLLAQAVNDRLAELRMDLANKRYWIRNGRRVHWGPWPGAERERRQVLAERRTEVQLAERELKEFIARYRPLMGPDWIGNDHGRLCWNFFRGGLPIGRHFCQLEEGHEGHHCDEEGGWIEGSRF